MEPVIIDGTVYVAKKDLGNTKIVVLDKGFVYVGQLEMMDDRIVIHNARCIIRWGTDGHLGQLKDGPLKGTTLGAACEVEAFKHSVIHMIEVDADAWR